MKYLMFAFLIVMISIPAFAADITATADGVDGDPMVTHTGTKPFDLVTDSGNFRISYVADPLAVQAFAQLGNHDDTVNGIRVYFDNLTVTAGISGDCEAQKLVLTHSFNFGDLKLFQGATLIGPSTGSPPPNDTYTFDGGTATFNAVTQTDNSIRVIGLMLAFANGETHTYGHAYALASCTTPVDLQSFTID